MEKKISILYIGSSADAINVLSEHPGISLTHAEDAMAATNFLKSFHKPEAVLCELHFPGGDGFEIFKFLRSDSSFKYVVFILICQEFKEDIFKKAFKQRMDDFFVMPLTNINGLVKRISYLVNFLHIETEVEPYHMPLIKRLFDIVSASAALILLSPILLLVIIAIRIESKGKVYYISKRRGRGLDTFNFYKLRSMRVGADAELSKLAKSKNQYSTSQQPAQIDFSQPCPECSKRTDGTTCSEIRYIGLHKICDYWYTIQKAQVDGSKAKFVKISNDPRVTKVGKFIRNTSIDELPQLINVIKGDMSIVGNRPLPVYEADLLTKGISAKRALAPAGITGLWQVELRGKGGVMSESEREDLDNQYADHFSGKKYSFFYDLKLILRTAKALFQKDSV